MLFCRICSWALGLVQSTLEPIQQSRRMCRQGEQDMRTQMVTHELMNAMGMTLAVSPAAPRATHSHILKLSSRARLCKETFTALSLTFHFHPEPNRNKPSRQTIPIPWHNFKKTNQTCRLNSQTANEKEGYNSLVHHLPCTQTNPGPIHRPKWHVKPLCVGSLIRLQLFVHAQDTIHAIVIAKFA